MTLCSLTFSLKQPCCCGRNCMHFHYWGCLSGALLTTSCYCLSQDVDGHYIAEVQWQIFNFPVLFVCMYLFIYFTYFATDRRPLPNTGNREKKLTQPDQGANKLNVTTVIVNNNYNYLLCAVRTNLPKYPSQ